MEKITVPNRVSGLDLCDQCFTGDISERIRAAHQWDLIVDPIVLPNSGVKRFFRKLIGEGHIEEIKCITGYDFTINFPKGLDIDLYFSWRNVWELWRRNRHWLRSGNPAFDRRVNVWSNGNHERGTALIEYDMVQVSIFSLLNRLSGLRLQDRQLTAYYTFPAFDEDDSANNNNELTLALDLCLFLRHVERSLS